MRLYNDVDNVVRRLFPSQITIDRQSTERAIYFYGYLLEQTLRVFDVTPLELTPPRLKDMTPIVIKQSLMKQILMMAKIVITKENLYSNNGICRR